MFSEVVASNPCSLSLFSINPIVNLVPYIGILTCFKMKGIAPI